MEREEWNKQVSHPLQSYEWGEFREMTGVKVVRENGVQVTIHKIPHTPYTVGYCPKTTMMDEGLASTLSQIAKNNNCIYIKVEPRIEASDFRGDLPVGKAGTVTLREMGFVRGRSLFTKYNFVLDVTPSESELLASFKQKTRYNIRVAEKKGVVVTIDNSEEAINKYLELTEETTKRQGFFAHDSKYHRMMWEVLGNNQLPNTNNQLTANLLVARYNGDIITTWVLFKFGDTLYYPYGASTRENREVMANNLVMWEAIKLAKAWGLKYLDMWGALGPEPDPKDPWYGFHTFKAGYQPRHVEYIGSYDYVAKPLMYKLYRVLEVLRWKVLRLISRAGR